MVDDPNRKSPRQFQCRDYLWEAFEQMSSELECSIDYLINEAMRHYLRAQGRSGTTGEIARDIARPAAQPVAMPGSRPAGMPAPRSPALPPMPQSSTASAARPAIPPLPSSSSAGLPPLPAARPPVMPTLPQRPAPPGVVPKVNVAPVMQPRPAPVPAPVVPAASGQRVLYVIYGDQEIPITKEEFFIGRGQKYCDLVIRDSNVSRQHARVVFHNGHYWIIDNQSTNGVEYRGAKIQQKRVEDGDVFSICGHQVQFVYR